MSGVHTKSLEEQLKATSGVTCNKAVQLEVDELLKVCFGSGTPQNPATGVAAGYAGNINLVMSDLRDIMVQRVKLHNTYAADTATKENMIRMDCAQLIVIKNQLESILNSLTTLGKTQARQ